MLQNILCSIVRYGWGFELVARLDGTTVVPVTLALFGAVSMTLIFVSHLWLRRFDRGPLEWLTHRGYQRVTRADWGGRHRASSVVHSLNSSAYAGAGVVTDGHGCRRVANSTSDFAARNTLTW